VEKVKERYFYQLYTHKFVKISKKKEIKTERNRTREKSAKLLLSAGWLPVLFFCVYSCFSLSLSSRRSMGRHRIRACDCIPHCGCTGRVYLSHIGR
tara:strand:+ start:805 stop:1092 length:288 start_codon:yes stop_codon:yes gene_type:complete